MNKHFVHVVKIILVFCPDQVKRKHSRASVGMSRHQTFVVLGYKLETKMFAVDLCEKI